MASAEQSPSQDKMKNQVAGIRPFDFKMVRKLNQSQRIRLGALHSRFASELAKRMEHFINCEIETAFLGFEQVQGATFQQADYPDMISACFELTEQKGHFYSIWPREIAFFVIERKLGSPGDQLFTDKSLTELEKNILKRFAQELFAAFQTGFEKQPAPKGNCQKIIEGVEPLAEQMPYEILLMSRINIHVGNHQGAIVMVYPYSLAKPWIDQDAPAKESSDHSWKESPTGLPSSLAEAPLLVSIKMKKTPIKISDFNQLQAGDCIQLNQSIHEPFNVFVENHLKYKGYLGCRGRQLGIKVSQKVKGSHDKQNQQDNQ